MSAADAGEFPLTLSPLILFALECSEQRLGEMPATALPPCHPRMAPDGAAAPGTDLHRGEQESGAGTWLPQHRAGCYGASSTGMHEGMWFCIKTQRVPAGSFPDGA